MRPRTLIRLLAFLPAIAFPLAVLALRPVLPPPLGVLPPPGFLLFVIVVLISSVQGIRPGLLATATAVAVLGLFSIEAGNAWLEVAGRLLSLGVVCLGVVYLARQQRDLLAAARQERRKAEQAARESETQRAYLQAVLDAIVEGMILYNKAGQVEYANRTAREPVYPDSPLSVVELLNEPDVRDAEGNRLAPEGAPLGRALRGDRVAGAVIQVTPPGQSGIWLNVSAAPVLGVERTVEGAILTYHDVTGERLARRRRDEFTSVLSHELRTPLTAVLGYIQLLQSDVESGRTDRLARMLEVVGNQMRQLQQLIRSLLEMSRLDLGQIAIHPVRLDLRPTITQTAEAMRSSNPDRQIELSVPDGRVMVLADPVQIGQVMNNLLDNALKYSPANRPVRVTVSEDGRVCVQDFGQGIAPEERERIFEPFIRGRDAPLRGDGNLGIGLYLAREIVRRHHGSLTLESTSGLGSTFCFQLPVEDATAGESKPL